jgi:5-methylthioadenosine/S-adenosylhomocysteine deaminase
MRILSADWVVPVAGPPLRDGAVAIGDDGRIAAVGAAADVGKGERFAGCVILPGFVNAHSHLEYAVYGGFGDGLSFGPWVGTHVARKQLLGVEEMDAIARVGAADCLASGITTVGDASFSGSAALACAESGLRAIVYLEVFGADASALDRFHEQRGRIEHVLSDRLRLGVSPHAPYTCGLDLYRACATLGLPVATHLNESDDELAYLRDGSGPWSSFRDWLVAPPGETGVRLLAAAGLLGPHVVAAHCVRVDDDEVALLAEHDVAVAHCPRSNAQLGCGTAPLAQLRAAGLRTAIATDSPASAPSFDMFDELRFALLAARARERDPVALSAAESLELATLGGARALGLAGDVGSLEPGKWADLVVLSLEDSPFAPLEDPVIATILGGSGTRVTATLIAGDERYRKGSTQWRDSRRAARRARARMLP